ncbi:MAG: Lrp/AsnC family transcriptional regulator [Desulfurococcaceae archaeon]
MVKGLGRGDELDGLDRMILNSLREDSRRSVKSLAEELRRPVSTVYERIKRLERRGVIRRYTVDIDYSALGYTVKALILVNVDGKHIIDLEEELAAHPNVLAVYDITGEFDVALIAAFKSIAELDAFVKSLLKSPYVKQTRTSIVFRATKEDHHLPL